MPLAFTQEDFLVSLDNFKRMKLGEVGSDPGPHPHPLILTDKKGVPLLPGKDTDWSF